MSTCTWLMSVSQQTIFNILSLYAVLYCVKCLNPWILYICIPVYRNTLWHGFSYLESAFIVHKRASINYLCSRNQINNSYLGWEVSYIHVYVEYQSPCMKKPTQFPLSPKDKSQLSFPSLPKTKANSVFPLSQRQKPIQFSLSQKPTQFSPKDIMYLTFQSFNFEHTWWRFITGTCHAHVIRSFYWSRS